MPTVQEAVQNHAGMLAQIQRKLNALQQANAQLTAQVSDLMSRPTTITEAIDAIPGRRIESIFSGEVAFDMSDLGQRGRPVIIQISQDGDFIQTHYAQALWYPTAPNNATNLNRWRPVESAYLQTQEISGDLIDIKYELDDAGSQRFMQNDARGPVLSRPDNIVPCPVPTQWAPNASIKFTPTYMAFLWNGGGGDGAVAPTAGVLHVDLIGYRIVNL